MPTDFPEVKAYREGYAKALEYARLILSLHATATSSATRRALLEARQSLTEHAEAMEKSYDRF